MIGHTYWVWIWYGILGIGLVGLVPALHWGRRTHWRNLDELLRATGTVTVSTGMILLLRQHTPVFGYLLLFVSLVMFIAAFVVGRRGEHEHPYTRSDD